MKKLGLLLVVFLLVFTVNALAANVEVKSEPENYKVEAGGVAQWTLYIKNNQVRSDYYSINPDDLSKAPFSDVVENIVINPTQVEIGSLGESEVKVEVHLKDDLVADKEYNTFVWVKSLTNPEIKEKVELINFIISSRELVEIQVEMPEEGVIPGINMPFQVTFKNRGNKDLEGLDIYITSTEFDDQKKMSLNAYETLKTNFNFDIESTTLPGKYSMSIRVFDDSILRGIGDFSYEVVENPGVVYGDVVDRKFLKTITSLSRVNEGNSVIDVRVRHPVTLLGRLFGSVDPNPRVLQFGDGKHYVWDLTLKPGERIDIVITVNYRIILALLLLVVIGYFVFNYFKGKTLTINKTLFKIKDEREDVTELKILLHVVNKTDTEVHNIKVIDILPNLIKPTPDFATLKPERIQKGSKGMRMVWNIPKLETHEERVISYKVHSRLPLVGEVELPAPSVQYKRSGGKLVNVKGNKLVFMSKE